ERGCSLPRPAWLTRRPCVSYTHRVTRKSAAFLAFVVLMLAPHASFAEHEVYYRYVVLGYVADTSGKRRPGIEVELVREKTGFSYLSETDASGLYVIVARLGDESVGEQLLLRTGPQRTAIVARFDPADHIRERGTRVDLIGAKWIEAPKDFAA